MTKLLILLFIGTLLLLAVYAMYNYYGLGMNVEKFETSAVLPKVALFHAQWCPHCKDYEAKGFFDVAAKMAQENASTAGKVAFIKYDADLNEQYVKKYNIAGFPTIIGIDKQGKKVKEFLGDRNNTTELISFAQSLL
jgi:thiol-disulfide isomerase/thioredoxin